MKLTKPQQRALARKHAETFGDDTQLQSFLAFRRSVQPTFDAAVMVYWCGMWLGIEPDGYCHT